MKRLAFIFGIMCVGLIVLLETNNRGKQLYHHHEDETDPEDVWRG